MKPAYVYRAFDEAGVLLYVGCTDAVARRLYAHERDARYLRRTASQWWARVRSITVEHYETRDLAEMAEATAIQNEGPLFNQAPPRPVACYCPCHAEQAGVSA